MSMNELFTNNTQEQTSARELTGTAQLTATATDVANKILNTINSNVDAYRDKLIQSQKDHDAMDKLITEIFNLHDIDVSFLKDADSAVLDNMLKSQQSKRSRAKSKQMTLDNYKSMLVGAIAENLIRIVTGQPKSAGSRRTSGSVEFTEEELAAFEADQELLKKELRNVQSKKSIAKSKVDFDPESDKWQSLLVAEAQLKALRVASTKTVEVEVDTTKQKLYEILKGEDIDSLRASDSKYLLNRISDLIG